MSELQEFKVTFPVIYAGSVMGHLTVLNVEIRDTIVVKDVCTITVDLDRRVGRDFQKWLRICTDNQGTMSPEISIVALDH